MCPERHLDAAAMLGNEGMNNKKEDAGLILSDMVREIMDVMKVPDGLSALNYTKDDVPGLVAGAIPQVKFSYIVVDRVYPNPKTQPEPEVFSQTRKTQTPKNWKFQNTNLIKPENLEN